MLNSIAIEVHCNEEELEKETKNNMCLNQCQVNINFFHQTLFRHMNINL